MRPIKDLIFEKYWCIGYREYTQENSVVNAPEETEFNLLNANKRYWYADPFLFEKDGRTYIFVEVFDNVTEMGFIGCSEYVDGKFTEPYEVLKENFHLSYPYVFKKDGKIFMMPETHEDKCVQFYEAVDFPKKWRKCEVKIKDINAVDTVIENDCFIASVICPENDMSVDLCVFDKDGNAMPYNPVYNHRFDKRGAGRIFTHKGEHIRPAQCCENKNYGGAIIFNKITQCDSDGYSEEELSRVYPDMIDTPKHGIYSGIHTYARTEKIEIVDIEFVRVNLKRLFWILKRKL